MLFHPGHYNKQGHNESINFTSAASQITMSYNQPAPVKELNATHVAVLSYKLPIHTAIWKLNLSHGTMKSQDPAMLSEANNRQIPGST
jgi:hypothetical protein